MYADLAPFSKSLIGPRLLTLALSPENLQHVAYQVLVTCSPLSLYRKAVLVRAVQVPAGVVSCGGGSGAGDGR